MLLVAAAHAVPAPPADPLGERSTAPDEATRIQAAEQAAELATLDRHTVRGLARCWRLEGDDAQAAAVPPEEPAPSERRALASFTQRL